MVTAGRTVGVALFIVAAVVGVVTHRSAATLTWHDSREGRHAEFSLHRLRLHFAYNVHEPSKFAADIEPFFSLNLEEPENVGRGLKEKNGNHRGDHQECELPMWPASGIVLVLVAATFRRWSGPRDPTASRQTLRVVSALAACALTALGIRSAFRSPQAGWLNEVAGFRVGLTALDGSATWCWEEITDEFADHLSKTGWPAPHMELTDYPVHPDGGPVGFEWSRALWFVHRNHESLAVRGTETGVPLWIPVLLLLLPSRAGIAMMLLRSARLLRRRTPSGR